MVLVLLSAKVFQPMEVCWILSRITFQSTHSPGWTTSLCLLSSAQILTKIVSPFQRNKASISFSTTRSCLHNILSFLMLYILLRLTPEYTWTLNTFTCTTFLPCKWWGSGLLLSMTLLHFPKGKWSFHYHTEYIFLSSPLVFQFLLKWTPALVVLALPLSLCDIPTLVWFSSWLAKLWQKVQVQDFTQPHSMQTSAMLINPVNLYKTLGFSFCP